MSVGIRAGRHKMSSLDAGMEGYGSAVPRQFPRGLKIGFWFCIAVAIAVVLRRVFALSTPPKSDAPPQLAALDTSFASHATLTYVHILCALAFVLLLPLLFWHRTRGSIRIEQAFFFLGFTVGGTAYAMSTHAVAWMARALGCFSL